MWSEAELGVLSAILDQLIPANPDRGVPGAGELGVAAFLAVRASEDAVLRGAVASLLAQSPASGITTEHVRQLETDQPEAFVTLVVETYKGYYSRPDMRAKVGVGAHPVHPLGYAVATEPPEMMAELTAPVRARGSIFRDPKGGKQ